MAKNVNKESGLTFEARCWRVFEDSSMLGSFSVTVNGSLVIKDILLIKGKKGKLLKSPKPPSAGIPQRHEMIQKESPLRYATGIFIICSRPVGWPPGSVCRG